MSHYTNQFTFISSLNIHNSTTMQISVSISILQMRKLSLKRLKKLSLAIQGDKHWTTVMFSFTLYPGAHTGCHAASP